MERPDDWNELVLMAQLSQEERLELFTYGYVSPGAHEIVWLDEHRTCRRRRFTHGTYFRTLKGEFYVDSGGRIRLVGSDPEVQVRA